MPPLARSTPRAGSVMYSARLRDSSEMYRLLELELSPTVSRVVTMPMAAALEETREFEPDSAANFSASATMSLAEDMRASRSLKAVPRTASLLRRDCRPRASRPAMPTDVDCGLLGGVGVGFSR